MCVLTNERYITYKTGFLFCPLGRAPGVGISGAGGALGVMFFKHGHVTYTIDGDDEQNTIQVKKISYGQPGDLRVLSKGQISLNFGDHVNVKYFYTKLCACSHKR